MAPRRYLCRFRPNYWMVLPDRPSLSMLIYSRACNLRLLITICCAHLLFLLIHQARCARDEPTTSHKCAVLVMKSLSCAMAKKRFHQIFGFPMFPSIQTEQNCYKASPFTQLFLRLKQQQRSEHWTTTPSRIASQAMLH